MFLCVERSWRRKTGRFVSRKKRKMGRSLFRVVSELGMKKGIKGCFGVFFILCFILSQITFMFVLGNLCGV